MLLASFARTRTGCAWQVCWRGRTLPFGIIHRALSLYAHLAAQGKVPPKSSGYVRSLALKAREMATDEGQTPVICVESSTA